VRAIIAGLLGLLGLSSALAGERAAADVYQRLQSGPAQEEFFRAFPKGGDLHNHMGGGIYPEQWIEIAARRKFCIDERRLILVENPTPPCPAGAAPATTIREGGPVYQRFVDVMTLRGKPQPHDYFFREGFQHVQIRIPGPVWADELEAVVVHAYRQNLSYLELQIAPFGGADSVKLGTSLPANGSLLDWSNALEKSALFHQLVDSMRRTIGSLESAVIQRRPREAAAVQRRYIISVLRGSLPQSVFAQLAMAAELARVEPRVVALNLVGAEDGEISLRDFRLHMRMVDFLRPRQPSVHVTLHAGEMTPQILSGTSGTVPEALTFHITESIRTGHAERIGHGTDLRYEAERPWLLQQMRERGILAEICLTSEELIQELKPDEIPFAAYRQAGVPVSLNTDDEGIFRSDLSHEFLRAARDYHLSYGDLKELARNSIEYSFLEGKSLFRERTYTQRVPECSAGVPGEKLGWTSYRNRLGATCRAYLDANPKAEAQEQLEYRFDQFESIASLRRFQ
jgi:adenosine deaminase